MDEKLFDRFGFDSEGYNREGYNRMGYNREGYDRQGFNMLGVNKQGINKLTGRDQDGFDQDGFDESGFDREGYNREGYSKSGRDRDGFDQDGFDENGYDREGYDREGYNHEGYNRWGFGRDGFNAEGYDKESYDREGYSKEGFNRRGYNREGYDRRGFNKDGFNSDGYDKDGYDALGFNKEGFNRRGYNKEGYNLYGYNIEGFDKDGYDREGYDKSGFNRDGYNRQGYDKNGYDSDGYDKDGYDCEGYDKEGFNAEGYDRNGRDHEGFDVYGLSVAGITRGGFNLFGFNEEGFDILGYDSLGFDKDGKSMDGYPREMFDDQGFHIYTGFNLRGYDKEGFNVSGCDKEGYDRDGFSVEDGYNRKGYNREGYNKQGYDEDGFNAEGYNKDGYNRDGFDYEGYSRDGYNKEGYNRDGFDRRGYDVNGYNKDGELDPKRESQEIINVKDKNEDNLERIYFNKCLAQIRGYFKNQIRKQVEELYPAYERTYIDKWGFVTSQHFGPDYERIEQETNTQVNRVLKEPYFAHVDYKDDSELYLGKRTIHGWVVDWADERASLYYQYQIYIGDAKTDLQYVRDIVLRDGNYVGYNELYRKAGGKSDILQVSDERLMQIIEANRSNKKVHDIVESIQQNQYKIITKDKYRDTLVLGCAGSGKTMILMHKIRYIKYNNPDMDMQQIIVISPTDVLGRESKELSKILQTGRINQHTTASFYQDYIQRYLDSAQIDHEPFRIRDDGSIRETLYTDGYLYELQKKISLVLNNDGDFGKAFLEKEFTKLKGEEEGYIQELGVSKEDFNNLRKIYIEATKELSQHNDDDVIKYIRQIDREKKKRVVLENYKDVVSYMLETGCFNGPGIKDKPIDEKSDKGFFRTQRIIDKLDIENFIRLKESGSFKPNCATDILIFLQTLCDEPFNEEDAYRLLKEWSVLSKDNLKKYLEYIQDEFAEIEKLEKKQKVLYMLIDNEIIDNKKSMTQNVSVREAFNKLYSLYEKTKDVFGETLEVLEFFTRYGVLVRRKARISAQRGANAKNQYLFDGLVSLLGVKYTDAQELIIPISEAFACLYVLVQQFGKIDNSKKIVYVDEFQDFSPNELRMLQQMYPKASLNLFGDYKQCINAKGISSEEELPTQLYKDKEIISENYRNASQITNYVKEKFNINMMPIGLNGLVSEHVSVPKIQIGHDDRVALIYKDNITVSEIGYEDINDYLDTRELKRGCINLIPISMVKGLEFEKVIVVTNKMTDNEQYVAFTRAISELYVVNEESPKDEINEKQPTESKQDNKGFNLAEFLGFSSHKNSVDAKKEEPTDDLITFFIKKGLDVVDQRRKNGALWVIGNPSEIGDIILEAKEIYDIHDGDYASSKSTGYKIGWYTKSKK